MNTASSATPGSVRSGDAGTPAAAAPGRARRPEEPMVWRVHPARERPGAALATLAVVAAFAWLCATLMQSAGWGAFAAGLLLVSLSRFFLPSRYEIDGEGVGVRHLGRRRFCRWGEVRRFVHDARGGHLSTRGTASFLDGWRGLPLMFAGNRDKVVSTIRRQATQSLSGKGDRHPTSCGGTDINPQHPGPSPLFRTDTHCHSATKDHDPCAG